MKIQCVSAVLFITLVACGSRSSREDQLIGTWTMPEEETTGYDDQGKMKTTVSDSKVEITFTKDHKEFWSKNGKPEPLVSRWRLEGDDLVTTIETQPKEWNLPTQRRERIASLTPDELVFSDGASEGRWKRLR